MIVDLIQLAGRARRGGTEAVLYMVDFAFHEDTWSPITSHRISGAAEASITMISFSSGPAAGIQG